MRSCHLHLCSFSLKTWSDLLHYITKPCREKTEEVSSTSKWNNCPEQILEILSLESLLTCAILVPQLHCLQSVVKPAEGVMGVCLPSDQDILLSRCRAQNIVKDSSHPLNSFVQLPPSQQCHCSRRCSTTRLLNNWTASCHELSDYPAFKISPLDLYYFFYLLPSHLLIWYEQSWSLNVICWFWHGATFKTSLAVKCCKLVWLVAVNSGLGAEIVGGCGCFSTGEVQG